MRDRLATIVLAVLVAVMLIVVVVMTAGLVLHGGAL